MSGVCFVVGVRPNFIKAAPVYRQFKVLDGEREVVLVHTGQHYDPEMSDVFLQELRLPMPDVFLGVGSGSHGEQTARCLVAVEEVLLARQPELVVVAGDVNSTLATALAAAKLAIPVAHIESGLRSFDPTMPEEHNRRLTDHVSSVLLVHSQSAIQNLEREGIDRSSVHFVGNTMIDSLLEHIEGARSRRPWDMFGLKPHGYGLVTLHRPSLVDDARLLRATVGSLTTLAVDVPLIFPLHPRTSDRLADLGLIEPLERAGVVVTDALPYLRFLGLEAEAAFVLTDSGGIQEETSALGVPCFTLRDATERPVTIDQGTNVVLGVDPQRIEQIPDLLRDRKPISAIPLWDGRAGHRAAGVLSAFLGHAARPRTGAGTRIAAT